MKIILCSVMLIALLYSPSYGQQKGRSRSIVEADSLCSPNKKIYSFAALDEKRLFLITDTVVNYPKFRTSLLASSDGGKAWRVHSVSSDSNPNEIYFVNEKTGFLADSVGGEGFLRKTDDAGKTWKRLSLKVSGSIHSLNFIDRWNGFAVGYHNNFLKTSDGGDSWEINKVPIKNIDSVTFRDATTGWILTMKQDIFRTSDGGKTWVSEKDKFFKLLKNWEPTEIDFRRLTFLDKKTGYLAVGYLQIEPRVDETRHTKSLGIVVFSTNDAGETWKPNVVSNDFNLQDAYFGKNKLFFLLAGFGRLEDSFFVSNDEGRSWTRRPKKNVSRDADQAYFVNDKVGWIIPIVGKTSDCVYRTNNGGKNWR